jgi:tripeptidyl-peptidase-1
MHFFTATILALVVGTSLASPTPRQSHVLHERRERGRLIKRSRADLSMNLPVRIALAQNNLHLGAQQLLDISDPESANFGKHLTAEEVGDLFRPSRKSMDAVRDWLHDSGIDTERHRISAGKAWVKFDASVQELEALLATEYHIYEHSSTQETHIGCDEYHIPVEMIPHIDFVTPSVSTVRINGEALKKSKRDEIVSLSKAAFQPIILGSAIIAGTAATEDITLNCSTAIVPDCLRSKSSTSVSTFSVNYKLHTTINIY